MQRIEQAPNRIAPEVHAAAGILKALGAREVYLFGSRALGTDGPRSDMDLAVRGLPEPVFFRAVGEVLCRTGLEIDLVDLDDKGPLMDLLRDTGRFLRVL